ncbi:hypothetical protein BDB00DRAFT_150037 [Zychaea mexicana]|uniref:uncharacterized protein n=1 Tax=Zychaea mexicana TaxID=64656 RepID=UPI0022FE85BA|nr:uncharacterized protein BDB00DRAFT_150037 [Zychaea mexicana]KAI9484421.1 hypothetical protein BDB00DRAFT_150037 [Zychaea mexicana]
MSKLTLLNLALQTTTKVSSHCVDQFLAVLTVVQPLSNHTTCCVVDFGLYVGDHETAETSPSSHSWRSRNSRDQSFKVIYIGLDNILKGIREGRIIIVIAIDCYDSLFFNIHSRRSRNSRDTSFRNQKEKKKKLAKGISAFKIFFACQEITLISNRAKWFLKITTSTCESANLILIG